MNSLTDKLFNALASNPARQSKQSGNQPASFLSVMPTSQKDGRVSTAPQPLVSAAQAIVTALD